MREIQFHFTISFFEEFLCDVYQNARVFKMAENDEKYVHVVTIKRITMHVYNTRSFDKMHS